MVVGVVVCRVVICCVVCVTGRVIGKVDEGVVIDASVRGTVCSFCVVMTVTSSATDVIGSFLSCPEVMQVVTVTGSRVTGGLPLVTYVFCLVVKVLWREAAVVMLFWVILTKV